jgi:hypothetical protein
MDSPRGRRISSRARRPGRTGLAALTGVRLARRGSEGAEQLVDVINACFSTLLAEAYARGGSLLEFGGPAATTVAMEAGAGAGQILISAHTARRLPRGCLGSLSG